jgi:1-acyl-sn-glycerol-3-phosphate acyltransferase
MGRARRRQPLRRHRRPDPMVQKVLNAWAWTVVGLSIFFGFFVVLAVFIVTWPFDRDRYWAGRTFRVVGAQCVWWNPLWSFHTDGLRIRDPRRPYVAVSNHESYADIFLISHLPWEMKWLGKEQLFKVPFLGWMMWLANDIPLKRGARESIIVAMNECGERLKRRLSVMIFPEGTRTPDGELLPFKDGAFRLAIEHHVPILPIAIAGTRRAMAKHTFQFQKTRAICRVLEPIETTGLTIADLAALKERTRVAIAAAKARMHAELGLSDTGEPLVAAPRGNPSTTRERSAQRCLIPLPRHPLPFAPRCYALPSRWRWSPCWRLWAESWVDNCPASLPRSSASGRGAQLSSF